MCFIITGYYLYQSIDVVLGFHSYLTIPTFEITIVAGYTFAVDLIDISYPV